VFKLKSSEVKVTRSDDASEVKRYNYAMNAEIRR